MLSCEGGSPAKFQSTDVAVFSLGESISSIACHGFSKWVGSLFPVVLNKATNLPEEEQGSFSGLLRHLKIKRSKPASRHVPHFVGWGQGKLTCMLLEIPLDKW